MITVWSEGVAGANMAEAILVDLAQMVRVHPWWRARARLVLALLRQLGIRSPARVLDAGCGWGTTLEAIERHGYQTAGMDVSRRTLEQLDRPGRELYLADLTRDLTADAGGFDAVLALDVIEHIDDDRAAVARLGRLARPGGTVIVSVPALPEFFSEFDEVQGHRRRYMPETLRAAFAGNDLTLERLLWWGQWLVPLLRRQRSRRRGIAGESPEQTYRRYLALPPWPAPLALSLGFALEQRRALAGKLHTGTSLLAIARRLDDRDCGTREAGSSKQTTPRRSSQE